MGFKRENNLETAIGYLENLLTQISAEHPNHDKYMRAVNTAVVAIRVCQTIKTQKHKKHIEKARKGTKNDAN